jgi:hypothetical protein
MLINFVKDFTDTPGGRFITDGPFSGELFRETILYPAVKKAIEDKDKVNIDFNGVYGLPPGFLDEAFGGLVRVNKLNPTTVMLSIAVSHTEISPFEQGALKDQLCDFINY